MTTSNREFKGAAALSTLASGINAIDTTISINNTTGWPTGTAQFTVVIDRGSSNEEKVLCSSRAGGALTAITRGYDGTSAAEHASGANIEHTLAAYDLSQLYAHATDPTINDHTQYMLKAGYTGSGAFSARPAFGNKGATFYATDTNQNGGAYYDIGTAWIRLSPSPWTAWSPTVTVTDGGGGTSTVTKTIANATYLYRLMPGNVAAVYIDLDVKLNGTQQFTGLLFSSPVASARAETLYGEGMNDTMRCRAEDSGAFGNVISAFPPGGYNASGTPVGQWLVDNANRHFRIGGTYAI